MGNIFDSLPYHPIYIWHAFCWADNAECRQRIWHFHTICWLYSQPDASLSANNALAIGTVVIMKSTIALRSQLQRTKAWYQWRSPAIVAGDNIDYFGDGVSWSAMKNSNCFILKEFKRNLKWKNSLSLQSLTFSSLPLCGRHVQVAALHGLAVRGLI